MEATNMSWKNEFAIETAASPESIWARLTDVPGWTRWNAGIEEVAIDGPFAVGACITMKPPGQEPLRSILIEVRENRSFVDETRLGELVVRVGHHLQPEGATTRVRYTVFVDGPEAAEVGAAISGDFPAVLAALKAEVES
jgi:hypothetical protein